MAGLLTGKFKGNKLNLPIEAGIAGGASNVAAQAAWPVQDVLHATHTVETLRHAHSAADILASASGGLVGVAAGTGISAYVNHLAHKEHERELVNRYRPQIGMMTGTHPDLVGVDELEQAAEVNPTLDQEMSRNTKMRNLRTATTLLATTAAFAMVFASIAFFPPMAALAGAAASSGLISGAGAGFLAATVGISFLTLHEAGKGIGAVGKKIFGLDKPTVEDHVHALDELYKKGEHIGQEQVMGVYVAADKDLGKAIKKTFGKPYHKLSHDAQSRVVEMFGMGLPLNEFAQNINNGDMNVRELSFAIHGQDSGVHGFGPEREHIMNEKIMDHVEPHIAQSQAVDAHQAMHEQGSRWQDAVQAERDREGPIPHGRG